MAEPWPSYRDATLATWADRITASWAADREVYVYFNNDQNCAAPRDAARLAAAVARRGGQAARAWPGWDGRVRGGRSIGRLAAGGRRVAAGEGCSFGRKGFCLSANIQVRLE